MNKVFFHVGYPKSASTTLQKQLFNKHSQLINLGLYPTKNVGLDTEDNKDSSLYFSDPLVKDFYDNLLKLDEINYHNSGNQKIYEELISKYKKANKHLLFSEERATSVFFTHTDIGVKAKRIKEVMPEAKIIFVIRNQADAIRSMYADFPFDPRSLSTGKPIDINKWIDLVLTEEFLYYRDMLNYYNVVKFYEELFGKKNICILLFEDLVNDKKKFAYELSTFMDINEGEAYQLLSKKHENSRVSHRYNFIRSIKRKYLSNIQFRKVLSDGIVEKIELFLKQGKSKKYVLSKDSSEKISSYYSKSNILLQEQYRLNVKEYNYPFANSNK